MRKLGKSVFSEYYCYCPPHPYASAAAPPTKYHDYTSKSVGFGTQISISIPPFQPLAAAAAISNGSEGDVDGDDVDDGIEIEIEKISKNRRRIRSKVAVQASLQTLWAILTDYERLADFIPGLAVSQVLLKEDNFARLLQIGQQNLAFGLKFKAKGIVDCYEKDFQSLPSGERRDIEFKMIDGDFQLFQGKWSIEEVVAEMRMQEQVRARHGSIFLCCTGISNTYRLPAV